MKSACTRLKVSVVVAASLERECLVGFIIGLKKAVGCTKKATLSLLVVLFDTSGLGTTFEVGYKYVTIRM